MSDNKLRKKTGSYYTPPEVVGAMVRLADEALRDPQLFNRQAGFASRKVTVADPAVGTGTFLLGVMRRIAETVEADQGPGAVGPAIAAATDRLIGFELQFGPFAVAQLRLLAELQDLIGAPFGPTESADTQAFHHRHARRPIRIASAVFQHGCPHRPISQGRQRHQTKKAHHRRDRQPTLQGEGKRPGRLDRAGQRCKPPAKCPHGPLGAAGRVGR